jgi:hypothetical protein
VNQHHHQVWKLAVSLLLFSSPNLFSCETPIWITTIHPWIFDSSYI